MAAGGAGDVLLRFDPRDAEARLEAARSNRDRLQNQVAINRVILENKMPPSSPPTSGCSCSTSAASKPARTPPPARP